MQQFSKKYLHTALSALLGGAVLATPGAVLAKNEGFSATGTGQVLIYPYYTVNDGWLTLFNVMNVSPNALAVKMRFHEGMNSRDILDFQILLSPQDVWSGYLQLDPDGVVRLRTNDKTCTSPMFGTAPDNWMALNPLAYGVGEPSYNDGGPQTMERLHEGYVELIVLGECPTSATAPGECFSDVTNSNLDGIGYLTKHVAGVPRDCTTADTYFIANHTWDNNSVPGHGYPIARGALDYSSLGYGALITEAPLKGNVSYINSANGIGAGSEALHLDNIVADVITTSSGGVSLVTAQQYPYFLEPTIATAPSGQVWNAQYVQDLEDRFNWSGVVNEWSAKATTGSSTDWIINFPTKGYHVDQFCNNIQANNNRWRYDGVHTLTCGTSELTRNQYVYTENGEDFVGYRRAGEAPYLPQLAPFENLWTGRSDVTVSMTAYDREEGSASASGTAPSPAPPQAARSLPYETNVVVLGQESALGSLNGIEIDAPSMLASGAENGWLSMGFPNAIWLDEDDGELYNSLPVYGFTMKARNFGNSGMNYGQMMNHGYRDPGDND
jgi:hypothetical protein